MYTVLFVLAIVFGLIAAFTFFAFLVTGDGPFMLVMIVALAITIGSGCGAGAIHEPYIAEHLDDAVHVVNGYYMVDDMFYHIICDPNQSDAHRFAYGQATVIEEVEPLVVLEALMECESLSTNKILLMEELAAECGVQLPSFYEEIVKAETTVTIAQE